MDESEFSGSRDISTTNQSNNQPTQGLDHNLLSDENVYSENDDSETSEQESDEEERGGQGNEEGGDEFDGEYAMNCIEDFGKINPKEITREDILRVHFPDLGVAFLFYNWYGSVRGFSGRKSKILWNANGEMIQQTFLCHREGFRSQKNMNRLNRRRRPKDVTRCGCKARCIVHNDHKSNRWYIKYFNDVHNHKFIEDKHAGMLPAHRKMSEYDISQMDTMRKVGIKTPHIYGVLASHAGGYDKVRFLKKDMYNVQEGKKHNQFCDAKSAIDFLEGMRLKDDRMFFRHTVDEEGRLQHLFWCDGVGRRDWSVFGDVLAFDATYRKNKYLCPFIVFSGVNHHNMSIVFAAAIVGNECESTYVWVLTQFLEAMGGKAPMSVITDGDMAMRNAIRTVFPDTHHRLCAWHLIRNATSNVKNPKFVSKFKHCMLGDLDVGEFNTKWAKMVSEFGLEDNSWIKDLYDKREMWSTSLIRGNFFAGFRTTSRCEGLHSEFGKYVNCQNNLVEFLQHFFRWLYYMRYREVEADFSSAHGQPVIQTQLQYLEMSAASVYTREIFMLFRPVLERACTCRVEKVRRSGSTFQYTVSRYIREGIEWKVSFCQSTLTFKCSCQRLESLGIPCEHVIAVCVSLNIVQLPETVILKRWTKGAKDDVGILNVSNALSRDPGLWCHYVALVEHCKEMAKEAYELGRPEHLRKLIEIVTIEKESLKSIRRGVAVCEGSRRDPLMEGSLKNPARARGKGCGGPSRISHNSCRVRIRRTPTCGVCGGKGHYRTSCHVQKRMDFLSSTQVQSTGDDYSDEDDGPECDLYANVDMDAQ